MAVAVYVHPQQLSAAQYDEVNKRLEAAGQGNPPGRLHHSCFGEGDHLMVFEVWETQEASDKFGETLMPILAEVGIDPGQPAVMPVHNLIVP